LIANTSPTRPPTIASLDLLRSGHLDKRSSAGITVIFDPIASFEGVVLGSGRSPNLGVGIGCSGASLAASALAASDTSTGKKICAPTLGSSGRPVGSFNTSSRRFGFHGRAIALLISAFARLVQCKILQI